MTLGNDDRTGRDVAAKDQTQAGNRRLVIVESPTKAKTIEGYLGAGYDVEASVGHIRDLPTPSELPAAEKKGRFGKFAVDVDNDFEPFYVVDADKKKKVAELKRALKDADELFLATDEDREGEAIAWHLLQVLEPEGPGPPDGLPRDHPRRDPAAPSSRPATSTCAWSTPRRPGASSTGSTATRSRRCCGARCGRACRPVACSRSRPGWSSSASGSASRSARRRTGTSRPPSTGRGRVEPVSMPGSSRSTAAASPPAATSAATASRSRRFDGVQLDEAARARPGRRAARARPFAVRSVEDKPYARRPSAPFMTSTLQQEASRKLRMTAQTRDAGRAAAVRERLHHLHAYRLDDAVGVGAERGARAGPRASTAPEYVPDVPRRYERKVKNAQEAHEAIRPSGDCVPHAGRGGRRAAAATSSRSTT